MPLISALVTSAWPITLASGRPAGPGDPVDADPERDAALFASGSLTATPPALADDPAAGSPAGGADPPTAAPSRRRKPTAPKDS